MKKWVLMLLIVVLVIVLIAVSFFIYSSIPQQIHDKNISGVFMKNQVWSGEILITGDVFVLRDLTILPGTIVRFAVQDDGQEGYETPADGYNDLDPTRLISYGKSHGSITIIGKLNSSGTKDRKILFTSALENKKIADWEAVYPQGDGSIIEYAIIEYSRNGISSGDEPTPNSIFRNNIIRYTMWGPISTGFSSPQVYNNEIYECGHEGVDVQGGKPTIENNLIYDCHAGIVVLRGNAIVRNNVMRDVGNSIHTGKDAIPILENNSIELANENSTKKWCYENFCYVMFGDPVGTPILTEVYSVNGEKRYAVSTYRIERQNYTVDLLLEANWLVYGWKNDKFQKIEVEVINNKAKLPLNYSMYVFIPNPREDERDEEKFNKEHKDIYKIMAV